MEKGTIAVLAGVGIIGAYFIMKKGASSSTGSAKKSVPSGSKATGNNTISTPFGPVPWPFFAPQAPRADNSKGNNQPWYAGPAVQAAGTAALAGAGKWISGIFKSNTSDQTNGAVDTSNSGGTTSDVQPTPDGSPDVTGDSSDLSNIGGENLGVEVSSDYNLGVNTDLNMDSGGTDNVVGADFGGGSDSGIDYSDVTASSA